MENTRDLLTIAVRQHQAGRLAEAERGYRAILAVDPKNFRAWHLLGTALYQLGDWDGAAKCFRGAVAVDPRFADAHNDLGLALARQAC